MLRVFAIRLEKRNRGPFVVDLGCLKQGAVCPPRLVPPRYPFLSRYVGGTPLGTAGSMPVAYFGSDSWGLEAAVVCHTADPKIGGSIGLPADGRPPPVIFAVRFSSATPIRLREPWRPAGPRAGVPTGRSLVRGRTATTQSINHLARLTACAAFTLSNV